MKPAASHTGRDTQRGTRRRRLNGPAASQPPFDVQPEPAAAGSSTDPAVSRQSEPELHSRPAATAEPGPCASGQAGSAHRTTTDAAQDLVSLWGDQLLDLEQARIAAANRYRALTSPETIGEKGGSFGKGLDPRVAAPLLELVVNLRREEHQVELLLRRALRQHPLGPWVARIPGVGEKVAARLLAVIGDPRRRWDRAAGAWMPRTVSQLWTYCGHGDPKRSRRVRGERANYNDEAKMRVYLIAEACMKAVGGEDKLGRVRQRSPYRDLYESERRKYADALHVEPCVRCGPSGHPAPTGSPLGLAHQHGRAMRRVGKEILKDLWLEARRLRGEADGQAHPRDLAPDLSPAGRRISTSDEVEKSQPSALAIVDATPTLHALAPTPIDPTAGPAKLAPTPIEVALASLSTPLPRGLAMADLPPILEARAPGDGDFSRHTRARESTSTEDVFPTAVNPASEQGFGDAQGVVHQGGQ